ncbi:MAG: cysteine desulfurase-like protein [Pirellula sp.]|jgi:cysteine desulfurase family protein (TIGR01976 family)|nr:cysteine desulfurase-like protein [Pirellula sp.]
MLHLDAIRSQFPSLSRLQDDVPLVYLDGPAGTQVPMSVANRVSEVLIHHSANRSGQFATSREVDQLMDEAHTAAADLLQVQDPRSIAFGPNMTTLTFQFSRALARTWSPGDEVLVSSLDHDANFTPWILAARDAGATVHTIPIQTSDATLCMDSLRKLLSAKTRLVAVTAASNAVGSLTDIREIAQCAHEVGAELFVDAVHYAPHRRIDAEAWNCDFLVCSAYKFFGPHIGMLYGKPHRMQSLVPYKLRPAPDSIPGRWMTGTQNHACIAGVTAAIDYLASLSRLDAEHHSRRARLDDSFSQIQEYETLLIARLIDGLRSIDSVKIFGIVEADRMHARAPTIAFQVRGMDSLSVAKQLGQRSICAWHGNYYALPLTAALGTEPEGMVRLGCMHYNTPEEIDRTLNAIQEIATHIR